MHLFFLLDKLQYSCLKSQGISFLIGFSGIILKNSQYDCILEIRYAGPVQNQRKDHLQSDYRRGRAREGMTRTVNPDYRRGRVPEGMDQNYFCRVSKGSPGACCFFLFSVFYLQNRTNAVMYLFLKNDFPT